MPEIIQDWLGSRLGILLDLTPKNFGPNTQDGRLLAKLLYSYGVIPASVLNKIKESNNYHVCYENLTILKPWLNYIGVTVEESALKEMAGGQGITSVAIFYEVYLNLEGKDRLYYLSLQKERKVSEDRCRDRFKVDWVPEKEVKGDSNADRLKCVSLLHDKREMIEWHKAKCKEVVETIKKTKERFRKMMVKKKPVLGPLTSKHTTSQPLSKRELEAEETKATIDEFCRKQSKECPDLSYAGLMKLKNLMNMRPSLNVPNPMEAQKIMAKIKHKKRDEVYAQNFTQRMSNMVLDEDWKEIMKRQDDDFENKVAETLLKRCQYEKQMASKLHQMRNQKKVLAENRRMIESLKTEQRDKECNDLINKRTEMREEFWGEEEFEVERNNELHRRLYDEKVRARRKAVLNECTKITEDIIDIAIRVSEIRTVTGCPVPKSFMRDLKQLFFKNLSIFDLLDHFEKLCETSTTNLEIIDKENEEEEGEEGEEGNIVNQEDLERTRLEEERQRVLDDCDFNDYLNLSGPWMVQLLFPDSSETEVRHVVLGYIVHKLLEVKYPLPNRPKICAAIKPMKPTAVIVGLTEDSACQMLVDLMELRNILVVRVDDVINFVLSAYKEELSVVRDIDITFQKLTANSLKEKPTNGKEKEVSKKVQLLKKENPEKGLITTSEVSPLDKETQTPRMIPEDDPILSPNAELGKKAFEALGAGDPVPDPVIVSAIVSYVLSKQEDYDGWILLNYPILYSQARDLECALTGYQMLSNIDDMESLKDVEGFGFREPFINPFEQDSSAEIRTSKLLPRSYVVKPPEPRSYFDFFIKLRRIGDFVKRPSQDSVLFSPMESFYSDQEILFKFEYSTLNFQSMKDLGKTLLGRITEGVESDLGLEPKTSLEIFGGDVLSLNEKWDPVKKKQEQKKTNEKEVGKFRQKLAKESTTGVDMLDSQFDDTEYTSGKKDLGRVSTEPSGQAKPGDPDWEWVTGDQPETIQLALASLWESMEAVYIEDFKNIFFYLRIHRSNLLSYASFLRSSTLSLMNKEDDKQKVLDDFQRMFNDIEGDLRPDVDIKCELHVRVSELEQALMGIADERKKYFQAHVAKVTEDNWVSDEMASLVNYYLMAVQLEADRCVDSCQVINDYYLTLQQKIPDPKPFVKVVVPKLQVRDRKYSIVSSLSGKGSLSPRVSETRRSLKSGLEQGSRSNHERLNKTRSWMDKKKRSSENTFLAGAAEVILDILLNVAMPEDGMTPFHTFFMENVQGVTNEVLSLVEICLSETKKGDRGVAKNPKKGSDVKVVPNPNQNLLAEWSTALDNELARFQFRTKLILARGIFEMNEFLMSLLNVLSCVHEEISEMYLHEIHSISECCKLFRCAIEQEERIQPRLELPGSEFFVNYSILMYQEDDENPPTIEEPDSYGFTINQLSVLYHKLQRVAPDGEIIKRSFAFILEDLRVLRPEIENGSCVPEAWKFLKPDDITTILDEIYQDLEIVSWKDFIIYGMDIPMPTEKEILTARQEFQKHDPLFTELISRDKYDLVAFWFDSTLKYAKETEKQEKAKDLLFRMYQVNEFETNYSALLLAFCKDADPVVGFLKALALVLGKKVSKGLRELSKTGGGEDFDYEEDQENEESYEESSEENKVCSCKSASTTTSEKMNRRRDRCNCFYSKIERQSYDVEPEDYADFHEGASLLSFNNEVYNQGDKTRVPVKILSSLLTASFPFLPQLTILLDSKETFQETLNSIYDGLDSTDGKVDVDDLLNHKFISRLLKSTNKFKLVKYSKFKKIIPSLNETDWIPAPCSPKYLTCSPLLIRNVESFQYLN